MFPSKTEARKKVLLNIPKNQVKGWTTYSHPRGTTVVTDDRVRLDWYNQQGDFLYSELVGSVNVKSQCGTVICLPKADFRLVKTFGYKDRSHLKPSTGNVVEVDMDICYANDQKPLSDQQCFGAVKSVVENGRGNILPLKVAARMRYGASAVDVFFDGQRGVVTFLCWNCQPTAGNPSVKPIHLKGQRRSKKNL